MEKKEYDLNNLNITRNEMNGRFELDLNKLIEQQPDLFDQLTISPDKLIAEINEKYSLLTNNSTIYFINAPSFLNHTISNLRSKDLNKLIRVQGILKKVVQPTSKVESVLFECTNCGTTARINQSETKVKYPRHCACGSKGGFISIQEYLLDIQQMELEENMEDVGSRQPQKIKLLLENGLTDPTFSKFQVGNKVEVMGILTKVPCYISGKDGEKVVLEYMLKVINILPKEGYEEDLNLEEEELKQIKEIAALNPLQILSENIAPNISGLDHIKKSIILFLAKGITKQTGNERRRGEMHMLVVGDAGLAKSALIQNIQKRACNCRIADGKNTSKAGIVATVNRDKNTEQWSVEAGDMVLANKGYLLIDEADKLPNADIQALHRPMEQGEAVISKAGIHANLRTETSVFAVANPKAGKFDKDKTILSQLDFSPTLLSRFDLIFILKDNPDNDMDMLKADRILNVHLGDVGGKFSAEFIKKYFMYVHRLTPKLTKEAADKIKNIYTTIRNLSEKDGVMIGMPITPRHLEGLIRLSEAHAKIRLSDKVEPIDVEVAEGLFKRSLSEFGLDLERGIVDLAGVSTNVRSGKKDKYFKFLSFLKDKAKVNNLFNRGVTFAEAARHFGWSYAEIEDLYAMLYSEAEIYERDTNRFHLVRVD